MKSFKISMSILFFFLFLSFKGGERNVLSYLSLIHKGKMYYLKNEYRIAKKYFNKAFKIYSPINYTELNEFENYIKIDFLMDDVKQKTFNNIEQ